MATKNDLGSAVATIQAILTLEFSNSNHIIILMNRSDFLTKLDKTPEAVEFTDTMAVIEANYTFTETAFKNGETNNEAGTNSGSCKLFAFAKLQNLSQAATLACFGDYYRKDVLDNPNGTDHGNIRNFMKHGWDGIQFEGTVLTKAQS